LQRALSIIELNFGAEHYRQAPTLAALAEVAQAHGSHAEAEALHRRGLALQERVLGDMHPAVARSLERYARFLRLTGQDDGASVAEGRARAIRAAIAQ
jgi:hypothetical protein